jgi:hypothetical protein
VPLHVKENLISHFNSFKTQQSIVSTVLYHVYPFFQFVQPKKVFFLYTDNIPGLWEVIRC